MSRSVRFQASRREFLAASAGAVLAALTTSDAAAQPQAAQEKPVQTPELPVVDTHVHLWDLSKLTLPWMSLPKGKPLAHDFLLKDYDAATAGANVVKTVYMEVACDPKQHAVEAEYVINLCRQPGSRMAGAVIGGSLQSERFADYIKEYAQNPYVKGVRMVLHDPDRPKGMCLQRQFVENIHLLGQLGLSFDLCMRPAEIIDALRLIEKCPQTRFIIDHCGNWDVQSTDKKLRGDWERAMREAAAHPNVACKISGIIATARPGEWKPNDLAPTINFCLDSFGDRRVFFGGDWPVCTPVATWRQWLEALQSIVANRSQELRKRLFHDNAVQFYKLS
jgi:predicted TIM-barrel fold metal-dependent hydrolase